MRTAPCCIRRSFWSERSLSAVETLAYPRMSPMRVMLSPKRAIYGNPEERLNALRNDVDIDLFISLCSRELHLRLPGSPSRSISRPSEGPRSGNISQRRAVAGSEEIRAFSAARRLYGIWVLFVYNFPEGRLRGLSRVRGRRRLRLVALRSSTSVHHSRSVSNWYRVGHSG